MTDGPHVYLVHPDDQRRDQHYRHPVHPLKGYGVEEVLHEGHVYHGELQTQAKKHRPQYVLVLEQADAEKGFLVRAAVEHVEELEQNEYREGHGLGLLDGVLLAGEEMIRRKEDVQGAHGHEHAQEYNRGYHLLRNNAFFWVDNPIKLFL